MNPACLRIDKRRQRVHSIIQGYLDRVAELVREGQTEGSVRADLPADTVSVMFLGLIQPAVILWLISDGAFDVAIHAERAWQIFSRTIQADGFLYAPALTKAATRGQTGKRKRK